MSLSLFRLLVDNIFRDPENWRPKKLRKEHGGYHRVYFLLNFIKEEGISSHLSATKDHFLM